MKILSSNGQYYCKVKSPFKRDELVAFFDNDLKMRKGSFAEIQTKKIISDLFQYARDLRQEYNDYYIQEYESFEIFLYQKELWDRNNLDSLEIGLEETVLQLHVQNSSYNAEVWLNYEEDGLLIINQMLEEISL